MADEKEVKTFVSLRKEKGLTQKQIADALEVSEDTVANWENGRSIPKLTISQVKELCRLLEKPVELLPDDFSSKNAEA